MASGHVRYQTDGTCTLSTTPVSSNYRNQLGGAFTYDGSGDLTYDGTNTLTYDAEGRIATSTASGSTTTYVYGADGQRIGKIQGGVETNYARGTDGSLLATYVGGTFNGYPQEMWVGGKHFGTVTVGTNGTQTSNFSLTNWLGSEVAHTNSVTGVPCAAYLSQPYGDSQTALFDCDTDDIHFTGKERDAESGLDYFGARYYASSMGRFTSPDFQDDETDPEPVPWANFTNPQSMNLYSYVYNDPVSHGDRDGHDVNVCDNQGHCQQISNVQYQAAQQAGNGGLNVPTLNQVGMNGNGSGQFNSTAITDASGNTVGTATYVSDGPTDYYANRNGIDQIAQASATVGPIAGAEMAVVGIAMGGMFAAEASPVATGLAGVGRTGASIANKLNHIFGKASHNLDGVVQACGGRQGAYEAIQNAAASATKGTSGPFEVTVSVGGENVVVRGTVSGGEVKIGTAWKQ